MSVTYRASLGRPLTWSELDENFRTLSTASAGRASAGENNDITGIYGLLTPLSVSQGGTGAKTPQAAIDALGISASFVGQSSSVGAALIPSGTTAERPSSPVPGMFRYNTSASNHERRVGSTWYNHGDMNGPLNEVAASSLSSSSSTIVHLYPNTITITGTTAITTFGSGGSGVRRTLIFSTSLILTHNATSLVLPGNANITTQPGDSAEIVSLGSGNWKCLRYTRQSVAP